MGDIQFKDVLDYLHAGGQSALLVLGWLAWRAVSKLIVALDTLTAILNEIRAAREETNKAAADVVRRLDELHNAVIEAPMNIRRGIKR